MRLRTHLLTSALAGIAIYRHRPLQAALLTGGGVLLDLDHYLLYALRSGDWNPIGALRYNQRRHDPIRTGDTQPRYGSLRSIAHWPLLTLPLAWLLTLRASVLRPLAIGITLHLVLDISLLKFDLRVWRRARGHCERCGVGGLALTIYYLPRSQRRGSRWAITNRRAWCRDCAQAARSDVA